MVENIRYALYFLNEFKALTGIAEGVAPVQPGVLSLVGMGDTTTPLPFYAMKTPSRWRYATDDVQAHFALEALRRIGPVVAFTVWCSAEIDAKARATGRPLAYLRKRVADALRAVFGSVELIVTFEEERVGGRLRLHLHGALVLDKPVRGDLGR